ncbi:MAG: DNA polymerase III subunit gamma/tau [Candidatus Rokubacteria bacterium]|nr:DNA polymerase III subunit gamma/tau [Candidatus Rokubacteria bacterium]
MTYQVLARKWRPQVFAAVVGQDPVTRTLQNALASGRVAHAYLFTGPRGVGKTTTARLLAKALSCTKRSGPEACGACPSCEDFVSGAPMDVMEIDAASNTGVDDIRTLRENVKYAPARGRFKIYIVDEVHMLSGPAFNAFLKTLEEPPAHVVFVLATTDPRKIPATVLSRCQRFDFRPIPPEQLTVTLTEILTKEAVRFEPGALPLLVRAAEGSLRDALSLLDTAIAYGGGALDESSVARLLGSSAPVHVRGFLAALLARDGARALEAIDRAARDGEDLAWLCREVVEAARRALVIKVSPAAPFPDLTAAERAALAATAEPVSADELIYLLRAFMEADAEMRRSPHPRVELEIAAVRAARRPQPQAIEALIAKVDEAVSRLRGMPAARPVAAQPSLLDAPAQRAAVPPPLAGASARVSAERATVERTAGPQPEAPAEPVANLPAADLGDGWARAVEEILKKKALLGSVVQHGVPLKLEGSVLTIGLVASPFHREMLNDRANREIITHAVQQHIPGARRVEIAAAAAAAGGAINHPAVQAAVAMFQGEVVAVRPRAPEEKETA